MNLKNIWRASNFDQIWWKWLESLGRGDFDEIKAPVAELLPGLHFSTPFSSDLCKALAEAVIMRNKIQPFGAHGLPLIELAPELHQALERIVELIGMSASLQLPPSPLLFALWHSLPGRLHAQIC